MHCFLHAPRPNGEDEEDYVDPDIVEPVFFPETVEVVIAGDDDEDDDDDDDGLGQDINSVITVSEAAQFILTGLLDDTEQNEQNEQGTRPNLLPSASDSELEPIHVDSDNVTLPTLEPSSGSTTAEVPKEIETDGNHETGSEGIECATPSSKRPCESPESPSQPIPKRLLLQPEEDSNQGQSAEEPYSNPLASAEDVEGIDDEAIRGDRIGETTYSERHVIKILMKWIEELPKYSAPPVPNDSENGVNGDDCDEEKKLERVFKKEMTLLWDMSSEPDVMTYLVDKGVFGIIRESLMSSRCDRLTEISLGILANILSSADMSQKLAEEDNYLKLIETVVTVGSSTSEVPILLQICAVLRRVTWFMHHVAPVESWISSTLESQPFLNMLTLILKGSTHASLIKDAVMVVFFLLEVLIPNGDDESQETDNTSTNGSEVKSLDERIFALGAETVVTSLCEGLQELLKGQPEDEDGMRDLIEEVRVVPHHIQLALRSGLGALCFIQKIPMGQTSLRTEKTAVSKFVTNFFSEFVILTSDLDKKQSLEYLVAGMSLLAFCHLEFAELQRSLLLSPLTTAQKLLEEESEDEGIQSTLRIAFHEHLDQLGRKFGLEGIWTAIGEDTKTRSFLEPVYTALQKTQQTEREVEIEDQEAVTDSDSDSNKFDL